MKQVFPQRIVTKARTGHRITPGVMLPHLQTYEDYLADQRYRPDVLRQRLGEAYHFSHWLRLTNIRVNQIDDTIVSRFAAHRCKCPWIQNRPKKHISGTVLAGVRLFVKYLRLGGHIPEALQPAVPVRLSAYCDYLLHQLGLSPSTISMYKAHLTKHIAVLGDDPGRYNAAAVRQLAFQIARRVTPISSKTPFSALRGYLRFLIARGECQPGLDHAVPTIASWRLSTLPRYLMPEEVEQLIASCDLREHRGLRDRAILLLLARLGLRGGDVRNLRFKDIDWKAATVRVRGKGRREVLLPLPQDAGDALLAYIERARATVDEEIIFLRASAPYKPIKRSSTVSWVVNTAIERAGIKAPSSGGAYLLRHSVATSLLRKGTPLKEITALLRHRSPNTTMHYAKVDFPMLLRIAQPWPRDIPC
jgi:integrase/recombinase XerD